MQQYINLLNEVLNTGNSRDDRTGVGTISKFGVHARWDLNLGFPAITTRRLAWRAVVGELLWFLEGSSDIRRLSELTHGTDDQPTIWHANVQAEHWRARAVHPWDAGRIYGVQWRKWQCVDGSTVDQIQRLVQGLRYDPTGRRHMLMAYNPGEVDFMCLPPCHVLCQFYVNRNQLSCQLYQRSADLVLGSPFNIASYSLLTHMIAQVTGLSVGEFIYTIGDAHIYKNHLAGVEQQLARQPLPLPTLQLSPTVNSIFEFQPQHIQLSNYQYHPSIKFPMAV